METTAVKKCHPMAPFAVAITFSFERFAFYVARWLLAIFVVAETANGGLGLTKAEGAVISSALVAWTYIAPVIGGVIADRWVSPRILVPLGLLFMGAGYLCAWQAYDLTMLVIMIVLVSIGTGFFKGNANGITGRLFNDPKVLDGVFSVQYSFVNLGSFLGTTIMSVVAINIGYRFSFLICGIVAIVGAFWFVLSGKAFLGDTGKKPFLVDSRVEKKATTKDTSPLTTIEKQRVTAIVLLTVISILFWMVWYMAYLPVYYHFGPTIEGGLGHANWTFGNFTVPSAWFDSLNALSCIILGPVLAIVWRKLSNSKRGDLNMFQKTALGMILLGSSIALMVAADIFRGAGQANILWIVFVGVVLTAGEMVFSPLGNSFINKFAPTRYLGTLLGVWPLAIFFVGLTYGHFYNFLDKFPFAQAFGATAAAVITCGVILMALSKKLNTLVHDDAANEE